jgi:putative N6-adenine-specific DNA methylase
VLRDEVTISADASGTLLHLRGYRQAVAKAPLRETLAAAMLLGAGWRGDSPLLDPMCGSGTIPIEAALLARNVAPGLAAASREPRAFAFTAWPGHDAAAWERAVAEAQGAILPAAPVPVAGSDRDAGAVEAARANAERAGVAGGVDFAVRPVSAMEPPAGPGLLICNPPYGVRVGESDALRNLYAALGRTARARCPGWTVALLAAERKLEGQVGIPFTEAFRTSNGGIPVHLVVGRVEG